MSRHNAVLVAIAAGLVATCLVLYHAGTQSCASAPAHETDRGTAWWDQETQMEDGVLSFRNATWYVEPSHALESFSDYDLDQDGDPDALICCIPPQWILIIDDNDSMEAADPQGDYEADCWTVDRDGDGLVDRMVDYIDENNDGVADRMEIRYYDQGFLRYAWFWEDLDGDGKMWDIRNFEYGSPNKTDMSGENILYANKYDEGRGAWLPFGECPFCFYDPDGDGYSEIAIRMVAAPAVSADSQDVDYGNNELHRISMTTESTRDIRLVSVRHSFALESEQGPASPYTYDVGLTMSGSVPYPLEYSATTDTERREPRTVYRIPWQDAGSVAYSYSAEATALSWDEAAANRRWEGIFWIWERRILQNTGGATIKYDVRREYDGDASSSRHLYYSEVDDRLHLLGAEEGWIEVSEGLQGEEKLGEIRFFDTTGDGTFDRWEVDLDGDCVPERIASVPDDASPECFLWDYDTLKGAYAEILARAITVNLNLIDIMKSITDIEEHYVESARSLEARLEQDLRQSERRYCLDLLREYYFQAVLRVLGEVEQQITPPVYGAGDKYDSSLLAASTASWEFAEQRMQFQVAYEEGRLDDAATLLRGLADICCVVRLSEVRVGLSRASASSSCR